MITRAHIRRQLRKNGGIMNVTPRTNYFLGGIKDRIRKLIPKEIAKVSSVAAPFVAPFNPALAAGMAGLGSFQQQGNIGRALRAAALNYGGGQAARYLGGAEFQGNPFTKGGAFRGGLEGFKGGFSSPLSASRSASLFGTPQGSIGTALHGTGEVADATPGILGKLGLTKGGGSMKMTPLGMISGASLLTYFMQKGKTEEEAEDLAQDVYRGKGLGLDLIKADIKKYRTGILSESQMFDKGYHFLTPRNYIGAKGGRVKYQTGGVSMDKTRAENIAANKAQAAGLENIFSQGRSRLPGYTPQQQNLISEYVDQPSILGPATQQAARTMIDRNLESEAALDMLNKTSMSPTGTGDTGIMTQAPTTGPTMADVAGPAISDASGIVFDKDPNKAYADGDVVPGTGGKKLGTFMYDGKVMDANRYNQMRGLRPTMADVAGPARTGMEEAWATRMLRQDPITGESFSQDRPFGEVVPDFDKYGKYTGTDPYISRSRAAGLGTPTHQLVKLDDGNYYMWDGSSFTKTDPEQIERNYYTGMYNQGGRVKYAEGPKKMNQDGLEFIVPVGQSEEKAFYDAIINDVDGIMSDERKDEWLRLLVPQLIESGEMSREEKKELGFAKGGRIGYEGGGPLDFFKNLKSGLGQIFRGETEAILADDQEKINEILTKQGWGIDLEPEKIEMIVDLHNRGSDLETIISLTGTDSGTVKSIIERLSDRSTEADGGRIGLYAGGNGTPLPEDPTKPINPWAPRPKEGIKSLEAGASSIKVKGDVRPENMKVARSHGMNKRQRALDYEFENSVLMWESENNSFMPMDMQMELYNKLKKQMLGRAEGGRIGKLGGGLPRIPMGMPRVNAGGIRELDYRQSGGFVPMGVKEKADDVPAMLSKNEFVMTADAVKGAGGGSVEKGAQRMYDTMKRLEGKIA